MHYVFLHLVRNHNLNFSSLLKFLQNFDFSRLFFVQFSLHRRDHLSLFVWRMCYLRSVLLLQMGSILVEFAYNVWFFRFWVTQCFLQFISLLLQFSDLKLQINALRFQVLWLTNLPLFFFIQIFKFRFQCLLFLRNALHYPAHVVRCGFAFCHFSLDGEDIIFSFFGSSSINLGLFVLKVTICLLFG